MSPAQASVGLGFLALVSGLFSLWSIFSRGEPGGEKSPPEPISTTASTTLDWPGVDGSIQRVLVDLGLASGHPDGLHQVPDEVTRALAGLQVPLVVEAAEDSG